MPAEGLAMVVLLFSKFHAGTSAPRDHRGHGDHAFRLRHELFRFRATVVVKKDRENWKEMYHFQEENLFLLYVFLKNVLMTIDHFVQT